MKKRIGALLLPGVLCFAAHALADPAPAVQTLGSEQAARHLAAHIYARTDGWDGALPFLCPDETCATYGHVRVTGRRVSLWDSPRKGSSRMVCYPGGLVGYVGPDTQIELTNVVAYQNRYCANIRVLNENGDAALSGFVSADYIACDCESYDAFEDVDDYTYSFGAFSLK